MGKNLYLNSLKQLTTTSNQINLEKPLKIFISPLDWGLGHTTRCIPIAKELNKQGHSIFFGVNNTQRALLEQELDFVNFIKFEGYNIKYPKKGNMAFKMLLESPKILSRIRKEQKELNKLIGIHQFDLIISDNRFGLHSNKAACIYITHQINIQGPKQLLKLLHNSHGKYIKKYSSCWIPDSGNNKNLGGKLSHDNIHNNCKYIGPITRFDKPATSTNEDIEYLGIISGPEPQRSKFEKQLISELQSIDKKCAIIGGSPETSESKTIENIEYFPHLDSEEFYNLVCRSEKILCRSGYSSIMDFSMLQKPVHFIPTAGQTEQEYLAILHGDNNGWSPQNKFQINENLQFNYLPKIESNQFDFLKNKNLGLS